MVHYLNGCLAHKYLRTQGAESAKIILPKTLILVSVISGIMKNAALSMREIVAVIVRSDKAQKIFQRMQQDGYIETVRELSEAEVENGQM